MAVLSDDIGGITAYAAAVNRGYTGTKEEFEQLMYSYTEVAERAEAAAGNAHESEEASIEAKDISVGAKNEAVSARDAAVSARDASISAKNDSESARYAAIGAKNDTLAAKDAVMSAKGSVDETSADFSEAVTAAISDVNAAGRNQKELAKTHAIDSEAWAVGQREGADVGVNDETYHNNSKYYAEQSALAKSETETARDTAITAKDAAEQAKVDTQEIVDGIQEQSDQIQINKEDISDLKNTLSDMQSDGVVPSAEQILTDKGVTDCVPYHYRKTGGDGADRLYDQIVGGSVAWNQLVTTGGSTTTKNGVTFTKNSDGTWIVSGTATDDTNQMIPVGIYPPSNHVICVRGCPVGGSATTYYMDMGRMTKDIGFGLIDKCLSTLPIRIFVKSGTTVNNIVFKPQATDITAALGSAIAEHIYNMESANTGDGVKLFKSLFPKDLLPYDAGSMQSVSGLSEHKMVGFNQWDEETANGYWDKDTGAFVANTNWRGCKTHIPCLPNTAYCFHMGTPPSVGSLGSVVFYDADKNYISAVNSGWGNAIVTAPSNAHYLAFYANPNWFANDICINLSDPAKNGTYEPYKAHRYPLDSTLTLRGIPKLVDGKMRFDGDVYEYTGKVTRNTILRAYQSGDESLANAITDGTNTVVYSANASTEQANPYQHLQQCDPNGTEEYVSTGIVPVGHNSFYPENLRAKVEQLPWNFASLIAPTEATFTATQNYTTGSLFIVDNVLYKATSNIANGGTITPNTNCTATTLAEIISALA